MKNKGGPDVIKLFEQLRKNITLNKSWDKSDPKDKAAALKSLRKEFYDGLIRDLMDNESFTLSEIVMSEKLKEKFSVTVNDEIIGLNIFAAQKKMAEYREKFDILNGDAEGIEVKFDHSIASQMGKTLMKFDTDEFKNERLMMAEKIVKRMRNELIKYD